MRATKNWNSKPLKIQKWQIFNIYNPQNWFHVKFGRQKNLEISTLCSFQGSDSWTWWSWMPSQIILSTRIQIFRTWSFSPSIHFVCVYGPMSMSVLQIWRKRHLEWHISRRENGKQEIIPMKFPGRKWTFPLEISWVEAKIAKNVHNLSKQLTEFYHFYSDITHCRNFMIFLSLRFYVKSILENLEVLKMPFLPFLPFLWLQILSIW